METSQRDVRTPLFLRRLPAAGPRARKLPGNLETWLGLALVVGLLAYVLIDWLQSTARSDAYHDGLAAVAAKDWDRALGDFTRASDLRDAKQQAQVAAGKVDQRNHAYSGGKEAAERHEWSKAITDFSLVQSIQPGYSGVEALLADAKESALREGLDGIAYQVGEGQNAGLYVCEAAVGAIKLPGSDKYSTLHASSDDGRQVAYDVPAEALGKLSFDTTAAGGLTPSAGAHRVQVLARLDAGGSVHLTPALQLDAGGYGLFREDGAPGVWWFKDIPGQTQSGSDVFYFGSMGGTGSAGMSLASQGGDTGGRASGTYKFTRVSDLQGSGQQVMAIDPWRAHLFIAQLDVTSAGGATRVFEANADGSQMRLLTLTAGYIRQASVSRDGRWLLYVAQSNEAQITKSAWVLSLGNTLGVPGSPQQLESVSWSGAQAGRLSATFVPDGAGRDYVLTSRVIGGQERLAVFDPMRSAAVYELRRQSSEGHYDDMAGLSPNGSYFAARRVESDGTMLELVVLMPGRNTLITTSAVPLPVYNTQLADVQFTPLGDHVLVTVQNPMGIDRGTTQSLVVATAGQDGQLGPARYVASAKLTYTFDAPAVALAPRGTLLVYINSSQELHTASLTGDDPDDTLIGTNVHAVWSLQDNSALKWWR